MSDGATEALGWTGSSGAHQADSLCAVVPGTGQVQSQTWLFKALQSHSSPIVLHNHPCCETSFILFSPAKLPFATSFPLILLLGQRGDHTESSLPCISGEQILASSRISLVEYHGIKSWREKGPKKLVHIQS